MAPGNSLMRVGHLRVSVECERCFKLSASFRLSNICLELCVVPDMIVFGRGETCILLPIFPLFVVTWADSALAGLRAASDKTYLPLMVSLRPHLCNVFKGVLVWVAVGRRTRKWCFCFRTFSFACEKQGS